MSSLKDVLGGKTIVVIATKTANLIIGDLSAVISATLIAAAGKYFENNAIRYVGDALFIVAISSIMFVKSYRNEMTPQAAADMLRARFGVTAADVPSGSRQKKMARNPPIKA